MRSQSGDKQESGVGEVQELRQGPLLQGEGRSGRGTRLHQVADAGGTQRLEIL